MSPRLVTDSGIPGWAAGGPVTPTPSTERLSSVKPVLQEQHIENLGRPGAGTERTLNQLQNRL